MIILILISVISAQLDHLRQSELGSTLLETVQLHIQANEPPGILLEFLNGIEEKLLKQKHNLNKNSNKQLNECLEKVNEFEQGVDKLKNNKYDVREEIYIHKPHIEQYEHMLKTKLNEREVLLKNLDLCSQRKIKQLETYKLVQLKLQENRYDYVNQKNPMHLKIEKQELKPLLNDLVDYVTDLISMEDKYFDEKQDQLDQLITLYEKQLNIVDEFIEDINDNIEQTQHQVNTLDLELIELNHKIELKQEQLIDIRQDCKNIFMHTKSQQKHLSEEINIVNQISQLIEHNFGWLKEQVNAQ